MTTRHTDPQKPTPSDAQRAKRPSATPDKAGNEGAPVGTGTPIARAPLPPSSGSGGAKKG